MSRRVRVKICCISSLDEARTAIAAGADALASWPARHRARGWSRIRPSMPSPPRFRRRWATFLLTDAPTGVGDGGAPAPLRRQHRAGGRPCRPGRTRCAGGVDADGAARSGHPRRGTIALELIPRYEPHVHAFLLDSGKPGGTMRELGGTGRTHDWTSAAPLCSAPPGGLPGGRAECRQYRRGHPPRAPLWHRPVYRGEDGRGGSIPPSWAHSWTRRPRHDLLHSPGRRALPALRLPHRLIVARLLELVYWPILNLLTWGFLQNYAMASSNRTLFVGGALVSGSCCGKSSFAGRSASRCPSWRSSGHATSATC